MSKVALRVTNTATSELLEGIPTWLEAPDVITSAWQYCQLAFY
jgi:hypothetical protein